MNTPLRKGYAHKAILAAFFATACVFNASAITITWNITIEDDLPLDVYIENLDKTYFAVFVLDTIGPSGRPPQGPAVVQTGGGVEIALTPGRQDIAGIVNLGPDMLQPGGFEEGFYNWGPDDGDEDVITDVYVHTFHSTANWGDPGAFETMNADLMDQAGNTFDAAPSNDEVTDLYCWLYIFEAPSDARGVDDATGYFEYMSFGFGGFTIAADGVDAFFTIDPPSLIKFNPIPEPATATLLMVGAAFLVLRRRRLPNRATTFFNCHPRRF